MLTMQGSGGLLTEYFISVHRGQADYWLNVQLVYTGVRQITDWIFNLHMQGLGRWLIRYSFGICRGPVDYWLNIQSVYAGVRQITDQIFIPCMQGSGRLTIGFYSRNDQIRWIRIFSSWNDWIRRNWIFNSQNHRIRQVGMIGICGSGYSIVGIIRLGRFKLNI
jgi:hypothetical protein